MHYDIEKAASNLVWRIRKCQHAPKKEAGNRMAGKVPSGKVRISPLNGSLVLLCSAPQRAGMWEKKFGIEVTLGAFWDWKCQFLGGRFFPWRQLKGFFFFLLVPNIPIAGAGAASQRFSRGLAFLPRMGLCLYFQVWVFKEVASREGPGKGGSFHLLTYLYPKVFLWR